MRLRSAHPSQQATVDAAPQDQARTFECAGCGGELFLWETVIAWRPIRPAWIPGRSEMAFIHLQCAAHIHSFDARPPQSLEQALAED
jgi:hypothetical protein